MPNPILPYEATCGRPLQLLARRLSSDICLPHRRIFMTRITKGRPETGGHPISKRIADYFLRREATTKLRAPRRARAPVVGSGTGNSLTLSKRPNKSSVDVASDDTVELISY
jgi:hypothetical protein